MERTVTNVFLMFLAMVAIMTLTATVVSHFVWDIMVATDPSSAQVEEDIQSFQALVVWEEIHSWGDEPWEVWQTGEDEIFVLPEILGGDVLTPEQVEILWVSTSIPIQRWKPLSGAIPCLEAAM